MTLDDQVTNSVIRVAIAFYISKIPEDKAQECYLNAFQEAQKEKEEKGDIIFNISKFHDSYRSKLEKAYLDSIK